MQIRIPQNAKQKNFRIEQNLSNGEVHGCYRRSAKRKGRKEKKKKKEEEGELWNVLEFGGMAGRKKKEETRKIKKGKGTCVEEKKRGEKEKEKKKRNCYHNIFTINFNG